ncbi:MAG: tetratricopeptide repeat protein [Actinobacteria bacterium]|nr:tetratricopeptide repeat protein [Actinomycetota bacterium]
MYKYTDKNKLGPGSIFFIILFTTSAIGLGVLLYLDKGKFWDILPYISIPVMVLSLILAVFNLVRRTAGRFIFIFFFIISAIILVLSGIFGPFALKRRAEQHFEDSKYGQSIELYEKLLTEYPNSSHAPEALSKIALAYYKNQDYAESLNSYKKALELKIVSWDDLEIKKIFSESHFLLAGQYAAEKNYLPAAENYLKSADILKEIKEGLPDTNEAFIAEYRIPGYLAKAGENYIKDNDYDNAINILERLLDNYPDPAGEFYNQAISMLLGAYIEKSILLSGNLQYSEAVTEFIRIFSLPVEEDISIPRYKKETIFRNVPAGTLKSIARDRYGSGDLVPALFLFQTFLEYYPDSINEVAGYIVDIKMKIITEERYSTYIQSDPGKWVGIPGMSRVFFENQTTFDINIYLKGPAGSLIIEVPADSFYEVDLKFGEYDILAELESTEILPYFGKVLYDENRQYREVFSLKSPEDGEENQG